MRVFAHGGLVQAHLADKAADGAGNHVAAFLAAAQPAHRQRALRARDAHVHQPALFLQAQRNAVGVGAQLIFFVELEGQQPLNAADQHHMRPLQSLGGVQCGQGHHVLLALALADGGQQCNGLYHLEHAFALFFHGGADRVFQLTATALRHPVTKIHHVAPTPSGHCLAVLGVVQMLFVVNVFEPVGQEHTRIFSAHRVFGAVFQFIEVAAKLLQGTYGLGR